MAESLVLLAIAVILFRGFGVEGYLISTGSMAPTLLGYHHRVTCPECAFVYATGTRPEEDSEFPRLARADLSTEALLPPLSQCPNCGYQGIVTEELPRTEGDQLLVHKHAYEFRDPRRWEVIVFRNPGDPQQAYVKRVAGLPGETVQLQHGNVLINGSLARKPYHVQRAMCIPISKYGPQLSTDDPDSQPAWVKTDPQSTWTFRADALECRSADASPGQPISWIGYRHWIRGGGTHVTRAPLSAWPATLHRPSESNDILRFDKGQLQVTGALTEIDRRTWLARNDQPEFQQAIHTLFEQSHVAPILDDCEYNPGESAAGNPVNEFLISLTLSQVRGPGRFEIELSDGETVFSAIFRFDSQTVEILRNGDPVPVRKASFPSGVPSQPMAIDFSLIDEQVVLAVNGHEIVAPLPYQRTIAPVPMRRPVRLGAAGLDARITNLELFRDVYYTPTVRGAEHPEKTTYPLGSDQFFVLGDNSPVSVDSRAWDDPAVPRTALIGKPLVVHLPSRSRRINWNGKPHDLRLPDFSRARLVR